NGLINVPLPKDLHKALAAVVQEFIDDVKGKPGEKLLKSLLPTVNAGHLEVAVTLRGPSQKKEYTGLAAVRPKDGLEVEKGRAAELKALPPALANQIKLNAAKAGKVQIHKVDLDGLLPDTSGVEKVFGKNPVYVAFREDAMFLAAGDKGLDALKKALAAKPKV